MSSSTPRVAVVGAGALGLCTAYHLTELGVPSVTVLDRGQVAGASSGLSVGIIETQYLDPLAIEIRVRSMELFRRLEKEHGLAITRNGYLRLAHDDDDLDAFAASVRIQRELGVGDAVVLDRDGLARAVPDLECADLAGGLYGPSDGYVDGHSYCSLLADLVRGRGGQVLTSAPLLEAHAAPGGGHRLVTSQGAIDCDVVVNAAGAWAGRVGALLEAPAEVLPQRHQALIAHLPRALDYVMPSVMDYIPSSGELGLYFRHESATTLIAGLHTEERLHDIVDPDDYGRGAEHEFMEEVARRLAHRLPALAGARLGGLWAGLYPLGPDGVPIVGPYPDRPTVVAVVGAGGSGLQSSPALGLTAAEWIVHGGPRTIPAAAALAPRWRRDGG
ncbi:MAG TPA: FAD-binding oxidoreductase [Gaiellaceae bacterium]|nr:FAD-binding oxidoreductase [Gaiellaceae bacterium]